MSRPEPLRPDEVAALYQKLSNWGRFGERDQQRGTASPVNPIALFRRPVRLDGPTAARGQWAP